ncbi:MAG: S16 family serine protease [Nitrososphaera sp.]
MIASQRTELETKSAQLEELQSEIGALAREIDSQESQIAEKTKQVEQLQDELGQLQSQAILLEQDIASLRSEIQAKDADLADLILENASARRVHVSYFGLGVDENGAGVVFPMELEIIGSGDGRISVDVSNVDYQTGFQEAVRTAAAVAADYTGIAVSDKDIIIRLVNNSDGLITVDGPSAGAAMTAMMIAGLTEKQPDSSVLVTGTIRSDGTIGRVGGLAGKADAASAFGADKLLVPMVQQFQDGRIEVVGVSNVEELVRHIIPGEGAT